MGTKTIKQNFVSNFSDVCRVSHFLSRTTECPNMYYDSAQTDRPQSPLKT